MIRTFIILCLFVSITREGSAQNDMNLDLNLAAGFQVVQAESMLRAADLTLVGLADLFSDDENDTIDPLITHNSLNRKIEKTPGLQALFTVDVAGQLLHDSFIYPTRSLNLRERGYIQNALMLKPNQLFIGKPIPNQFIGFDSLPVSRAIFNTKNHLKGVAVAILTPDHLLDRSYICTKCLVSVFKTNGEKMVSFPASMEKKMAIKDLMKDYAPNTVFDLTIRTLKTKSLWVKFSQYDLVLLYSYVL